MSQLGGSRSGCREGGAEGSHVTTSSASETKSLLEATCPVVQSQFLEPCRAGSGKTWGARGGSPSDWGVERMDEEG